MSGKHLNWVKRRVLLHPATKKLVEYGVVGLVIATAVVAGVQYRPANILPSNGTLQLLITDAPLTVNCPHQTINLTSLVVTIGLAQVHRSGGLNLAGEWVNAMKAPKSFDLLQLKNATQLLGSTSIPESSITLVRLSITSTNATTTQGKSIDVVLSSGKLEVKPGGSVEVRSGMRTSLVVDFQPHLVCEGNGTVRLTPVLVASSKGPEQ